MNGLNRLLVRIGKAVGGVVGALYQAGRDSVDTVIRNILPFMAFIALIIGIITKTGVGDFIARHLAPLAGTLPGLLVISIVCAIPVLSPLLGPGAVIAQIVGRRWGGRSAPGRIPRSTACRRWLRSTPRLAAASSRSGSPWARPSRRRSRSGFPRCCSRG